MPSKRARWPMSSTPTSDDAGMTTASVGEKAAASKASTGDQRQRETTEESGAVLREEPAPRGRFAGGKVRSGPAGEGEESGPAGGKRA